MYKYCYVTALQGPHAEFTFQLENLGNTSSLPFTVSSDGAISLSDELNFEEAEFYLFRVGNCASDLLTPIK